MLYSFQTIFTSTVSKKYHNTLIMMDLSFEVQFYSPYMHKTR